MADGSVFQMPDELWQKAFNLECDDPSTAIKAFKEATHNHWLRNQKSQMKYKNEAELGKEIMHHYIHHSLFAIQLYGRAVEEGRDLAPELIVSENGRLTVYTGFSRKRYESTQAYLAEKKKTTDLPNDS